jgi:hypothetical protein
MAPQLTLSLSPDRSLAGGRLTGQPSYLLLPFNPGTGEDVTAAPTAPSQHIPAANTTQACRLGLTV